MEDDPGIGSGLVRALESQGYQPIWAGTGAQALQHPLDEVALVLLDLGLPDLDGLQVCRRLRGAAPGLPIVMLTARGTEADVVLGLDAGADDYLVKPFRLGELLARLRSHLRRAGGSTGAGDRLVVGDLQVDVAARRAAVAGQPLDLRAKEFDLLVALMRSAGRVVTRSRLMAEVWHDAHADSTKTVDVHLAALRQRLGEDGPEGSRITTLRGVGYRLDVPAEVVP